MSDKKDMEIQELRALLEQRDKMIDRYDEILMGLALGKPEAIVKNLFNLDSVEGAIIKLDSVEASGRIGYGAWKSEDSYKAEEFPDKAGVTGAFASGPEQAEEAVKRMAAALKEAPEPDEPLTMPTLHLNGSGYRNLDKQYREALTKIEEAYDSIPVPHARDYYVQDDGAFERARDQFQKRSENLMAVRNELHEIYRDIQKQNRG